MKCDIVSAFISHNIHRLSKYFHGKQERLKRMDLKKNLYVNIINIDNVDKAGGVKCLSITSG